MEKATKRTLTRQDLLGAKNSSPTISVEEFFRTKSFFVRKSNSVSKKMSSSFLPPSRKWKMEFEQENSIWLIRRSMRSPFETWSLKKIFLFTFDWLMDRYENNIQSIWFASAKLSNVVINSQKTSLHIIFNKWYANRLVKS